ncbi:RNA-binding cell elongation regulator Jag/EloR [Aureibacillus halotolerans]|uniref:RNA-binding protein KhpB n=1 Tax=Aureibacillus halotolerans TaxID=1508390 RepID=A0A4R6U5N3_9BACI|nr:RNA-binding cell elongation regulator Jag/EloR [Aureibacillus halotolerans]TDQ38344.1 spoIIIJ-associated protein [Aureibacillus halotolerans]
MSKKVTVKDQTVDVAVASALKQLEATRDQVHIDVIQEERKGFLGFFSRQAIVAVSLKDEQPSEDLIQEAEPANEFEVDKDEHVDPIMATQEYLQTIIDEMGIEATVGVESKKDRDVWFDIHGEQLAMVIGKRGQTLNALQQLAQLVINQVTKKYYVVMVDAEGYRGRRKETLEQLAIRMAYKAKTSGTPVQLEPMPSFERKIIHHILQRYKGVNTESRGNEPHRHVRITPRTNASVPNK